MVARRAVWCSPLDEQPRPLRRRVQRQVDPRFNRVRYDAEAALAAFSVRLKDAVDMTALPADLVRVLHGTLHPAHVPVWIQPRIGK